MMKFDKIIYTVAHVLLLIPILLFFLGFVRFYIGIVLSLIAIFLAYQSIKNYSSCGYKLNKKYWCIVLIFLFVWLFFSGIGGFSYQNDDFHVRNAVFRDLIYYRWPVKYDHAYFVYYFTYFLPSAFIGKITSFQFANIFLFFYSYVCIVTTFYFIHRFIKKDSYWILVIFILFSGLDILAAPFKLFYLDHLEWWAGLFQYSSNTTQLYWVFNQSIPLWLILSLIININHNKSIVFLSSLSFFFSPYATICLIPIALYLYLKNTRNFSIKHNILSFDVLFSLLLIIVLGSFYLSGDGTYFSGLIFNIVQNKTTILLTYFLFIGLELLLFIILTFRDNKKDILYRIIIVELLLIPLFVITKSNDFCMRSSIPALFLLMTFFMKLVVVCIILCFPLLLLRMILRV